MIRAMARSARPTAARRKPHLFVIPAKAESSPRLLLQHAPSAARPVPSSHAALGTGLRRYDGLDGWCLFAVACRYDGLERWYPFSLPCWHDALDRAFTIEVPPPVATANPLVVIPAKAGIQNPRLLSNSRPNAAARCCARYRPSPVTRRTAGASSPAAAGRRAGRWCLYFSVALPA